MPEETLVIKTYIYDKNTREIDNKLIYFTMNCKHECVIVSSSSSCSSSYSFSAFFYYGVNYILCGSNKKKQLKNLIYSSLITNQSTPFCVCITAITSLSQKEPKLRTENIFSEENQNFFVCFIYFIKINSLTVSSTNNMFSIYQ